MTQDDVHALMILDFKWTIEPLFFQIDNFDDYTDWNKNTLQYINAEEKSIKIVGLEHFCGVGLTIVDFSTIVDKVTDIFD